MVTESNAHGGISISAGWEYIETSRDGRPFGHNIHGPKSGGCCAPLRGGAGSPCNTMSPGGPRRTSVPSGILILDPSNNLTSLYQCYRQDNGQTVLLVTGCPTIG